MLTSQKHSFTIKFYVKECLHALNLSVNVLPKPETDF